MHLGSGIAQWLERRTRDWKVAGSNPCRSGGTMFFSRVNFLCWLLFRYLFYPRVTVEHIKDSGVHVKDPGNSAKSAGGRLQLSTHTPYLCDFEWSDTVTWCMVEWYTQNLRRNGATTTERYQYTTSVDINNTRYKKDTVTHSESQRAENSAI